MSDETMQLLKAYIEATGYEIREEPINSKFTMYPSECETIYEVTKKKPKERKQATQEGYGKEFLDFWDFYPKGHGGSKKKAFRQWCARLTENPKLYDYVLINGATMYEIYIKATGQHVMHPATFLGRDKHYLNDFTIPDSAKQANKIKLPYADDDLWDFARANDLRQPRPAETFSGYRKSLQKELDNRELNK